MSDEIGQLIMLPLLIIVLGGIALSVWIGGNGGDVSWISQMIDSLAVPALVLGLLLAAVAVVANAT